RRFAWGEQHAGAVLGCVRLAIEADDARFRRFNDVNEVVVAAGLDVEPATLRHGSVADGQELRTTQARATDRPFEPGFDRRGLGLVPIDDGNVANCRHSGLLDKQSNPVSALARLTR